MHVRREELENDMPAQLMPTSITRIENDVANISGKKERLFRHKCSTMVG